MHHGCKTNQAFGQTIFGKVEGIPPKRDNMGETFTLRPFIGNGGEICGKET
jgi:hypothetical protein